ncbi:MAG TPA: hypothetical protein VFE50_04695 [Cyclobacteriaceae bacterium]|nr:hypothetical protein [Cyclobacteriaceae bacterium]
MKSALFLLIFTCLANLCLAQAPDSITHKYDSLLKSPTTKYDSASSRINNKIDSIQGRINNLANPNLNLASKLKRKKFEKPDSLKALNDYDSMKSGLTYKIDSLRGLNLPTDRYKRKLDSLEQLGPQKYVQNARERAQRLEDRINKPINTVESKVNDKLNLMRSEGGADANIPGNLNIDGVKKPDLNSPDLKLPGSDVNVKNPLSDVDNPLKDQMGEVNELKGKANDLKSVPQQQIDKVKSIDEVQNVQGKVGDLNKATDKVQQYEGDVKNIAQGNVGEVKQIPDAIENKAKSLDEIKELQAQTGELNKAREMVDKGKNPEALKAMGKQEVMKKATDHFAGKEQVLKEAMDKMSKVKSKYGEVKNLAEIPKRPPNPMKGKPFIERLVPGVTLQFQKANNFMVDFNPVIAYRVTGHLNAGAGWNERFSFLKWNKLSSSDRIYGPRVFVNYSIKKGFGVKAELEKMNAVIPLNNLSPDAGTRQWVWSAFVGLKKDYKFIGRVNGNVQILYNIFDDHDNSPYTDKLNVRMGFEFPMKKKKKPVGK